jgi:hypothetical protein
VLGEVDGLAANCVPAVTAYGNLQGQLDPHRLGDFGGLPEWSRLEFNHGEASRRIGFDQVAAAVQGSFSLEMSRPLIRVARERAASPVTVWSQSPTAI